MYELVYQVEEWLRRSKFFNDKESALKEAKRIIAEQRWDERLDWATVYSGYFGEDHQFHHSDMLYDYYLGDNKIPQIYEAE